VGAAKRNERCDWEELAERRLAVGGYESELL
jgi:hypothetical protein